MSETRPSTTILTIAGSDSGGGAGIQADLKTFSALGLYGASVITAVTAQNTCSVTMIEAVSPAMVRAQISAVLDDLRVGAIKIGMLGTPDIIGEVASALKASPVPIVLDPVMIAKSGDRLLVSEAIEAMKSQLLPLAHVLTPNLPEAAELLGMAAAQSLEQQEAQGRLLCALGPKWVLMKGGHADGPQCNDLLIGQTTHHYTAPRLKTRNTHGTGCTLSAAIAVGLGQGLSTSDAVAQAHRYLQAALSVSDQFQVGQGCGPVHHFHAWWA